MHTSFKNVLGRTFRQSSTAANAPFTVAAWLVPAAAAVAAAGPRPRPQRRHFSRSRQRCAQPHDVHHDRPDADRPASPSFVKPRLPVPASIESVAAWIDCLEPLLPPHLSATPTSPFGPPNAQDESLEAAQRVAFFLARSREHEGVDILSYLAIELGRWDAVMWVVKAVADISPPEEERLKDVPLSVTGLWDGIRGPLDLAVEEPLALQSAVSVQTPKYSLDQLTDPVNYGDDGFAHRNGALGQIWRSLGNMILIAVGDRPQEKNEILGHVLELLAHLHHAGVIPESVYHYEPPNDKYALQQPPTLYLLSTKILSALSDAAWRAHESAAASRHNEQPRYTIFGKEIPSTRFKMRTPELGAEVWLELVLWSCLHGSWMTDGAAVLKKLVRYRDGSSWSVLHWKHVLHDPSGSSFQTMTWADLRSFGRARGTQAESPERLVVDKTISSEVVAAYVDGMLDKVMVGVGERGEPLPDVIRSVAAFRDLLHRNNLGLGAATWESIISRFLETGSINPNVEARWMERLLRFSSKFDEEPDYHNAAREFADSPGSPSYILDPSSLSLGVLHQALRIHITNGNLAAAAAVVSQLQSLTDENKKRSMHKFFNAISGPPSGTPAPESSSTSFPPRDYPAYFPQIPPTLLAGFLNLATQTEAYDVGKRLLYSDAIDGPLIPQELYRHSSVAAAITRYAVAVDDVNLLDRVTPNRSETGVFSPETSWAILEIQVQRQRWGAVENVIHNLAMNSRDARVANMSALIAKQLLIAQHRVLKHNEAVGEQHPLAKAASTFHTLIKARYNPSDSERRYRFHGVLCVLSSVGPVWAEFCSRLFFYRDTKSLDDCVKDEDFAHLLQGVTETRGAYSGMKLMVQWCEDVSVARHLERRYYLHHAERHVPWAAKVDEVAVQGPNGTELLLRGQRLALTLPLMRTVYRAALKQIEDDPTAAWGEQNVREVLSWSLTGLRSLGLTTKEIWYELNGITRGFHIWDRAKAQYRKRKRPSNRLSRSAKRNNEAGKLARLGDEVVGDGSPRKMVVAHNVERKEEAE